MVSFLYYGKKTDATYVTSKSQGPIGSQAGFYCSSCLPLFVFWRKTSHLLLFPQSKYPGVCQGTATSPFAGFRPKHWFLLETGDSFRCKSSCSVLREESPCLLPCHVLVPLLSALAPETWPCLPPCLVRPQVVSPAAGVLEPSSPSDGLV